MKASLLFAIPGLLGAGLMLCGYSGPGRLAATPAIVPYVCEDGRQVAAIYESGGDHRHAKVLVTYEGRTTELEAAPTLYGRRYLSEPSTEEPRHLMWSLRGEHGALAEATAPEDVTDAGRPIARCTRVRGAVAAADPGHAPGEH